MSTVFQTVAVVLVCLACAASCGGGAKLDGGTQVEPLECTVVPPTSCTVTPTPTYGEIAPIIENRCSSCHASAFSGPWPLKTYEDVADWQDTVRSMVSDCSMPPPDAAVPITDEERTKLLTWIVCGVPR